MIDNKRRNFLHKSTMLAASGVLTACGGGGGETAVASAPAAAPNQPDQTLALATVTPANATAIAGAMFTLSGPTTVKAAPYSVGYAFRRGDVPAGSTVTGSIGTVQVTPKNVWPDGSMKFAVISGTADVAAGIDTKVGLLAIPMPTTVPALLKTAKLRATEIVAEIGCGSYGTVSWTGADWDAPFESWVSGPVMSSWIYRKPVGTDSHLVAWLEVRLWATGAVEVLPWIENGYLRVAAPVNKSANFTFTLGKTQRFSAAIDLKHHQRTPLVAGTDLSYWLSTAPGVTPLHASDYLQATELVPTYSAVVPAASARVLAQVKSFTPLQQGGFDYDGDAMASPGYQSSIGLLPEHDVLHLVANAADRVTTYGSVIRNGYSAGRYGVHYRDETTNRPPAFSSYPTLVFRDGAGFRDTGASTTGSYTLAATGGTAPQWDTAHSPSVGYMAYLLTGRFYFKEETQFAVIANHFNQTDWVRGGGQANYAPAPGYTGASGICVGVQTRGSAWKFRALTQALAITPDSGDPLRAELIASVEDNCRFFHQIYVAQPNNPFGMIDGGEGSYGDIPGKYTIPAWQQDFVTAAWGMALSLGLPLSSAATAKMSAFFAWKAKSVVGRLGTADGWNYINAVPYTMPIGAAAKVDYFGGTGPWLPDFKTAYDLMVANFVSANGVTLSKVDGTLGMGFPDAWQPSMWHNLMPALAYTVRHGVPGAQAAFDRVRTASNWPAIAAIFNVRPVWAVQPAGVVPAVPVMPIAAPVPVGAPAWLAGRALNEWHEIPGTSGAGGASIEEYSGWARVNNMLVAAACGGHHLSDNRVVSIDLGDDAPKWITRMAPSTSVQGDVPRYADGKPTSRHIYHMAKYMPGIDRVMLLGTRFAYSTISTGSFLTVDGFDLKTNTWDPAGTYPNVPVLTGGAAIDENGDAWATSAMSAKFSAASRTWSTPLTVTTTNYVRYPWALDTKRKQLFGLCYGDGEGFTPLRVNAIKQVGGIQTAITFNPSAALDQFIADTPANAGMDYDSVNDFFLFYAGFVAGRMYKVIPNAGTVWDMEVFSFGAGSETLLSSGAGILSRFSYVPALKGFVLLTHEQRNLSFMRTA